MSSDRSTLRRVLIVAAIVGVWIGLAGLAWALCVVAGRADEADGRRR